MERDPKTSPAPGDVLTMAGVIELTVVEVIGGLDLGDNRLVLYVDRHGHARTTTHAGWREWAASPRVHVLEVGS